MKMLLIPSKKINNDEVNPVPQLVGQGHDNRPVKGESLFAEPYANVFVCAKKKSGKSTVLFKIIKECSGPQTQIIAFVSTLNKDANWINIQEYCRQRGLSFTGHTSVKDGKRDLIDEFIQEQQEVAQEELKKKEEEKKGMLRKHHLVIHTGDETEEKPSLKKKIEKFLAPEFILIFDDLSSELKSKSLVRLLKMNRHYKAKCVISSQYLNDLLPESRKQMDYFLLFKSFPEDKLKQIYKDSDISIPFATFKLLYEHATKQPYSFLYVDTRTEEFRMNFNILLRINIS